MPGELRAFRSSKAKRFLAIDPRALDEEYPRTAEPDEGATCPGVAIISITGPLEHHAGWWFDSFESISSRFQAALDCSDVSAVVLKIDSPGGEAAGNLETARSMIAAKEKSGKKVWTFANEAAYSAAYALACVGDKIYLPETGGVGSIGCLCVAADMTKMVADEGINAVVVRSGSRKAEGHPLIPLTDETLGRFQSRVDDLAQGFAAFVAEMRGGSARQFLALEGSCFYGSDAVKKKLADGVMSFDAMIERLMAQVEPAIDVAHISVPSLTVRAEKAKGVSPMNLEQLKAALAAAQAAGDAAKVSALQVQIAAAEEDSEDEGSEEESDEESDEDSEEDPKEEEEETKKTTTVKTYRRSKKSAAAIASAVEEVFPGLSAAQVTGKLMALRDGQSSKKTLEAKVKQLETENRQAQVQKLVARGVRAGKITPAQKDYWTKQGMRADGVESLKEYLDTASPVVSTESLVPSLETPTSGPGGMSAIEATIAAKMNVTPEQFQKQKALGTTVVLTRVF